MLHYYEYDAQVDGNAANGRGVPVPRGPQVPQILSGQILTWSNLLAGEFLYQEGLARKHLQAEQRRLIKDQVQPQTALLTYIYLYMYMYIYIYA